MDLNSLVTCYNTELRAILDQHAPLVKRSVPVLRREPWYTEYIADARRKARVHERLFKSHGRAEDMIAHKRSLRIWRSMLESTKRQYLSGLISENRNNSKALFRSMNKVMNRKKSNPLPEHNSSKELADEFCVFFKSKIDKIRERFDTDDDAAFEYDQSTVHSQLCGFEVIPDSVITSIIKTAADKSCDLDPIPTQLLKECLDLLSPVIARIVNLSMQTATMPDMFKRALVTPLLKKPSLDTVPSNYRPVSNLPFVSKVIEECVIRQLSDHMVRNGLGEVLQSAYKSGHSTETALIKVFDVIFTL